MAFDFWVNLSNYGGALTARFLGIEGSVTGFRGKCVTGLAKCGSAAHRHLERRWHFWHPCKSAADP